MAGKLEDRVKEIIVDQLGVNAEQVTMEASFIDDLGADSLDSVELIMAIYLQPKGLSRVFSSATILFPCKITGLLAEEGE